MKIQEAYHLIPQLRLRWLTIACFEVEIGGFTIVIDPCIGASPAVDFGSEVIEKADLILLSHAHWDHITDIGAIMERFNCPLLCGELTAPAVLRMLNCNPRSVYPMTPNLELDFGGAKVRALFGRHTNQRATLSEQTEKTRKNPVITTQEMLECAFFGHLEYRNYLITAPSGLKVLFWGNDATTEQREMIRQIRPDIALLQYTKQAPEDLAAIAAQSGVKVLIPHHMDLTKTEDVYNPHIDELERAVHRLSPDCLVITPERLKWYSFGLRIAAQ